MHTYIYNIDTTPQQTSYNMLVTKCHNAEHITEKRNTISVSNQYRLLINGWNVLTWQQLVYQHILLRAEELQTSKNFKSI